MIFRLVCLILLAVFSLTAQVNSIQFTAAPPALASNLRANVVGAGGQTTYYYWVVARYPIGVSMRAGPVRVVNAANTLGGANSVTVAWSPATGATGYDVIRLVTPNFPQTGTCLNCVVASNTAATSFSDIGGAVVNWPTAGTVFAGQATASIVLNNRDQSSAFLQFSSDPHIFPTRGAGEYAYGFDVNGSDDFFTKTGVQKSYLLTVRGDRPVGAAATGDSNDALIRGIYNNYAANDANFIIRGLNTVVNNRSGGTLGILEGGLISASGKAGSTSPTIRGASIQTENFGTNATEHGGLDVAIKNETVKATLQYGVRIRNIDQSNVSSGDAALLIPASAGNTTGWTYGVDMNGAAITNEIRLRDGNIIRATAATAAGLLSLGLKETVVAPVRIAGEYAYGFDINPDDTFFTGAGVQKSYLLSVRGERPVGAVATGDSNDATLKMSYSNYAANDANFIIRGLNTAITNRAGGTLGQIEGGLISSATRVGGTSPIQRGLYVGAENYGTVADEFGGIRVDLRNEAAVATLEYGVKVINTNNSVATAVDSAYLVADTGANIGFNYGLNLTGATIQTADISLSTGVRVYTGNGAPAAGLCDAPRLGSLYLNLAGGAGTSLYVCEAAGAWAGK